MDHLTCDRCGRGLLIEDEVRYEMTVEVKAAYDPMELTADDLSVDHRAEMARLIARMERLSEGEAMDQVYRRLTFDLCPRCQKAYLISPWGAATRGNG